MRWYAAALDVSAQPDRLRRARYFVHSGLRHGTLKATIDRTFTLDEIAAAHAYLESNAQVGKVVVTVPRR
jgi:NADPH:quinone reductase-like Zn-dependent oxidoreductase